MADAEAFWSWVDYACDRDGHMKWEGVAPELLERAERIGLHLDTAGPVRRSAHLSIGYVTSSCVITAGLPRTSPGATTGARS